MKKILAAAMICLMCSSSFALELPWEKDLRQFNELTQEEQKGVLNCLCRCNSTARSHVDVHYNSYPDGDSPSCNNTSNGPCVNKGYGCWRHVPLNTGQCANSCYQKFNVRGVPDSLMNSGR